MNRIVLTGRLSNDPEVRYTDSGKIVGQFTVAVDRPFTNADGKRDADFIPCVIWGKGAEFVGNNFKKGKWIELDGRLQVRSYEAKDGNKRYVTEVIVEAVSFVGPKEQTDAPNKAANSFNDEIPF